MAAKRPSRSRQETAPALPDRITASWLRSLRTKLRRWHRQHGRELPWRRAEAYRVWISEIMLQQTTVAAVVPYFERFLAAFPTVESLAAASEQQVLRQWEGLGYYSRARNLHAAAKRLVRDHAGQLPRNVEELLSLPGIGRYTAGAIASFAYDVPAPIVEANTLRLYSRLLDYDGDPRSKSGQDLLWTFAAKLLPRSLAGDFNQALTDLGAMVCTPNSPSCPSCPLLTHCGAAQSGRVDEIPRPTRRVELTDISECAVVVEHGRKYLLRRCAVGERWAGLWDFPRFALSPETHRGRRTGRTASAIPQTMQHEVEVAVARLTNCEVAVTGRLGELRHGVTRYRITLQCIAGRLRQQSSVALPDGVQWFARDQLADLPLSTTGRKIVRRWIDAVDGQ
ncbi:MAG: A/G-specific adenine glycosylase [Planctomycetaceae bacterium]